MPELFAGPRLKVERAKQHIRDFYYRTVFVEQKGIHSVSVESDPQTGNQTIQLKIIESIPEDFPLIIGDALHNLKSALDITINQIIFSRLKIRDDYFRFPVRETRNQLISAVNGGKITEASKAVASFIVDVIKPYKGGNDPIWALHRLNIEDKHRLLLPVMQVNPIMGFCYEDDRGEKIAFSPWVVTRGRTVRHETLRPNVKIVNEGQSTLAVLFNQGLPYEGQSVMHALEELTVAVSRAIEGIGKVFLAEV